MKKLVCTVIVLLVCIASSFTVFAEEIVETQKSPLYIQSSGVYDYVVMPDGIAALVGTTETLSGSVTLPNTIGDYTVKYIGYDTERYFTDRAVEFQLKRKTEVIIPEGYTASFDSSPLLNTESIYIPPTFQTFASLSIFKDVKYITVSRENKLFASVDNVIFNKDLTGLVFLPTKGKIYYKIPDGTTSIGRNAMKDSRKIFKTVINIPESVTYIDPEAGLENRNIVSPKNSYAYNYVQEYRQNPDSTGKMQVYTPGYFGFIVFMQCFLGIGFAIGIILVIMVKIQDLKHWMRARE
jgi:hypothetical protein